MADFPQGSSLPAATTTIDSDWLRRWMRPSFRQCTPTLPNPSPERVLLLSSLDPQRAAPNLRRAFQVSRYIVAGTRENTRVLPPAAFPQRRFAQPAVGMDINAATPRLRRSQLPELLKAASHSRMADTIPRVDVVSELGVLVKLMLPRSADLLATLDNGTLFLESDSSKGKDYPLPSQLVGFHNACTNPPAYPTTAIHTFTTVLSRTVGGLSLLFACPVDCVTRDGTAMQLFPVIARSLSDISHMLVVKAYYSALLSDTPRIVVGLLDEGLVLRDTKNISPDALIAELANKEWSPAPGLAFAYRMLVALRDYLQAQEDSDALRAVRRGVGKTRAEEARRKTRCRVELVAKRVKAARDAPVEVYVQRVAEE